MIRQSIMLLALFATALLGGCGSETQTYNGPMTPPAAANLPAGAPDSVKGVVAKPPDGLPVPSSNANSGPDTK